MASVHPIMDALREKRIKRGMTLSKLARVANLSRESIRKRETLKFPSLMVLDRWCRALGYKLTLTEIDPPHPNQMDEIGERLSRPLHRRARRVLHLEPVGRALSLPKITSERMMVQTSEVRIGHDAANGLNSTQRWCILVQR